MEPNQSLSRPGGVLIGVGLALALLGAGSAGSAAPIIADHTVVDQYSSIPQQYIDLVKKMWLDVPGESHSSGYRLGLQLLENADEHRSHAPHFQMLNVEGARLLSAAARLLSVYQAGHATIVKLRQGGRQEVKVIHQHVQVTDGGQAVVAAEVAVPGASPGKRRGS